MMQPDNNRIVQNAGRCDICGKPIDMLSGDTLEIHEFGLPEGVEDKHGISDQEAADAVADALECVGETGADYDLAHTIREKLAYKVHGDCLEDTQFDLLTVSEDRAKELGAIPEDWDSEIEAETSQLRSKDE